MCFSCPLLVFAHIDQKMSLTGLCEETKNHQLHILNLSKLSLCLFTICPWILLLLHQLCSSLLHHHFLYSLLHKYPCKMIISWLDLLSLRQCLIKYLYYLLSLSIKCIPIEASGKQPLFCSVLCQSRPGCVTVSVCSVRVTVLASVPQKLASIYKFSTF